MYAAAIVYVAMHVALAISAEKVDVQPNGVSKAKLFLRIAAASATWTQVQIGVREVEKINPCVRLHKSDWPQQASASVPVLDVLIEPCNGPRGKRRYCKARKHWKSFVHFPKGRKLIGR